MAERIHPVLSRQLTERDLARLFNYGGIVVYQKDGTIGVIPRAGLEIEIQPPGSDDWTPVSLTRWKPASGDPDSTELIVVVGNFGHGTRGKHDKNTWRQEDFTNDDALLREGYGISGGHRGGLRQATNRPNLRKLFDQSYKTKKYR